MKKKKVWNKLLSGLGIGIQATKERSSRDLIRKQFLDISRLGGSPIVMKMGN